VTEAQGGKALLPAQLGGAVSAAAFGDRVDAVRNLP
jgi:hypothetical protein